MLTDFLQDTRFGLRVLRRHPVFVLVVMVSVALGIAANTAVFRLVNAVFLRPIAVRDPAALVMFSDGLTQRLSAAAPPPRLDLVSYRLFQQLRADNRTFTGIAAEQSYTTPSTVRSAQVEGPEMGDNANGRVVSANYFSVLGVPAQVGRTFLPEEETAPGANPVVVLSHGFWTKRFGADRSVVGTNIVVNGAPYTVIGVGAPGFRGTNVDMPTDFWLPMTMQPNLMRERSLLDRPDLRWLLLFGRLAPGSSLPTAEANLNVIYQSFLAQNPPRGARASAQGSQIRLESGAQGVSQLRHTFRDPLIGLMTGVGLLLIIVCLNVSHVLVAQAMGRRRELSIRMAIGASRGRLTRQLLTEGLMLSILGFAAAAVVTNWMTEALLSMAASGRLIMELDVSLDWRVATFSAALTLLTAGMFGLIPAWQARRTQVSQALGATAQSIKGQGGQGLLSRVLLTSQVALSLVLLVGAGLLVGSLRLLQDVRKGFDDENVLMAELTWTATGLTQEQALATYDELLSRVTKLPGVTRASLSYAALLSGRGMFSNGLAVAGAPASHDADLGFVTAGYFETVGMRVLRGRSLSPEDHQNSRRVAVINEALAVKFFGEVDAIGKRLRFEDAEIEVVGVIADARTRSLRTEPRAMAYFPVSQSPRFLRSLEVRTAGDPTQLAEQVRRTLRDVQPSLPIFGLRTMEAQVSRSLMQERMLATLSSAFGLIALFLVCLGLYGVISHWALQRRSEIGLRMALGATPGKVRWLVLRQALVLAVLGLVVGLPGALVAARLLESFLFGLTPLDPLALGGALFALLAVTTLAAYLPARRASLVDPMVALH